MLGGDFMLEQINFVLCGVFLPLVLCLAGIFFIFKLRGFYLLHPLRTLGVIKRSGQGFKPLCVALAGTLGVGNIVGVAWVGRGPCFGCLLVHLSL